MVQEYWKQISPIDNIDAQAPPAIVILGTNDEFIPVETAKRFERLMQESGVCCDLHLYQDQPHGFYSLWVSREYLAITMIEVDHFLLSLGCLDGVPILSLNRAETENK